MSQLNNTPHQMLSCIAHDIAAQLNTRSDLTSFEQSIRLYFLVTGYVQQTFDVDARMSLTVTDKVLAKDELHRV